MDKEDIRNWPEKIRERYENYLKTSFFFKDRKLRESFEKSLQDHGSLLKGGFKEYDHQFKKGVHAYKLAQECFPSRADDLFPALIDKKLYTHQESAICSTHNDNINVVVATGTASGKTESFLYPILFELYRQHLEGELDAPGVRAMILYPMNALANDQRERLGEICRRLESKKSKFKPKFGQYIGQTPNNKKDNFRKGDVADEDRLPGELIFREEMRNNPPHILLTNYSMLEYLLIRPDDSPLFDNGQGEHWQFIVLDEAHQYRGSKGMEMGMLLRRLKQRIKDGGLKDNFKCIATSATITTSQEQEEKQAVADFATELFDETFTKESIIFGDSQQGSSSTKIRRYHAFLRALEGAFLVHKDGVDQVMLNRKTENKDNSISQPIELALCKECGQHYYVGRVRDGTLSEADRDPSHADFGVDYFYPSKDGEKWLCKKCGLIGDDKPSCDCDAYIQVKKCDTHKDHPDQLKECEACGYTRGGVGDPVQEIVHGSDGPNTVIATALHELLPTEQRKVLAFADSRQEAAFFAWYSEDSYEKIRDRNLIHRAIMSESVGEEGLSIDDLQNRLYKVWNNVGLFDVQDTIETNKRKVLKSIYREMVTSETRLSLSGVGLAQWFVAFPENLHLLDSIKQAPWKFTDAEAKDLLGYLLDTMRVRRAINLSDADTTPTWTDISPFPQNAYSIASPNSRRNVRQWGSKQSAIVRHYLHGIFNNSNMTPCEIRANAEKLMSTIWHGLKDERNLNILSRAEIDGTFRLDSRWLRIKRTDLSETWECDTCATLSYFNVRNVCPRNKCRGSLKKVSEDRLYANHYRNLYMSNTLPAKFTSEEHTAQISAEEARIRQDRFKKNEVNLLSSSTTFEVGVDLGDLEVVFLRNVPPEPFNYAQRAGRAGRRDKAGLVITYCRRNPHDLYHFEEPEERIIHGKIHAPSLQMKNKKIILRHMVAVALSEFFRENEGRFKTVETFIGDWIEPKAKIDIYNYCKANKLLHNTLSKIVPDNMHSQLGLNDGEWIENIAGKESRLANTQKEVCYDYTELTKIRLELFQNNQDNRSSRVFNRMKTIASEHTINFLSRKAIIPKYGFPVDVVDLEIQSNHGKNSTISLQRDLSQAIAEFAPGGKVVADKLEWESCGIKIVPKKACQERFYQFDSKNAQIFQQWNKEDSGVPKNARKYIIPEFGFVTPIFKKAHPPNQRAQRLYTTRPFFRGFDEQKPEKFEFMGVEVTRAVPGVLVILCEGSARRGFYICLDCGSHSKEPVRKHKSPKGLDCRGTLHKFSLGHELLTDVVRLQFSNICDSWDAYSVAYAVLLGAASVLEVPDTDLNVTITGGNKLGEYAIVIYDNVPGGAGLVAHLEDERMFKETLLAAKKRVGGGCGCDLSCYGCLRNYRNQFAHAHLDRKIAFDVLEQVLKS